MRRLVLLLVALLPIVAFGDTLSKKELKQIEKDAKKEAKNYSDWQVPPGAIPLQRQLEEAYKLHYEIEGGERKYIIEDGMAVAKSYNAAKLQAIDAAKLRIASSLETEIAGLIESSLNNNEISTEDAATISEMISSSKSKIVQSLGRTMVVVELYQNLPNKTVRVMVRIAYSMDQARTIAKRVIYKDLEDKSKDLKEELDKLVDW